MVPCESQKRNAALASRLPLLMSAKDVPMGLVLAVGVTDSDAARIIALVADAHGHTVLPVTPTPGADMPDVVIADHTVDFSDALVHVPRITLWEKLIVDGKTAPTQWQLLLPITVRVLQETLDHLADS